MFVTVTGSDAGWPPTSWLPNFRLVGVTVTLLSTATPEPVAGTDTVPAVLVRVIVPLSAPVWVGVNSRFSVHDWPGAVGPVTQVPPGRFS